MGHFPHNCLFFRPPFGSRGSLPNFRDLSRFFTGPFKILPSLYFLSLFLLSDVFFRQRRDLVKHLGHVGVADNELAVAALAAIVFPRAQ